MRVAFPADMIQEAREQDFLDSAIEDMDQGHVSENMIAEQILLDTVDVAGLPQQEAERRAAWRKLPRVCQVAVRRLRRRFYHCSKNLESNFWGRLEVKSLVLRLWTAPLHDMRGQCWQA